MYWIVLIFKKEQCDFMVIIINKNASFFVFGARVLEW
jgi:hypothetical protein